MAKPAIKGFFITGTDTEVGKTIIAGAFIRALFMLGFKAGGMKPVETGCQRQGGVPLPSDGTFLKEMAHMEEDVTHLTPYALETPLAPLAASEAEDIPIEKDVIMKEFDYLSERYEALVVEGTGGLMVPITEKYFVLDMARELGLPLIIVSRPGLGMLNHSMLTTRYAIKEGMKIAGIVINHSYLAEPDLAEQTNPNILKKISPVPILGIFPYLKDRSPEGIDKAVMKSFNLPLIKSALI